MSAGLRAGYKQSEVGVIPEDWDEFTVGELIEFQGGSQPEKSVFSVTPRPGFVRLIQIRDYKSDKFEVFAPRVLLRRFCDESDIMIGRYGPPVFQILRGLSGAYNVALIKACPRPEIDRDFAYYFLKHPLPLPPVPEQRAIAAALSDVDALLGGLDRLIAKKQGVKQAAMQQLLTGQTRIPGFSGEWEVKRLDELADIRSGGTASTTVSQFWDGDIPWCTPTDITALKGQKFLSDTNRMITTQGLKASSAEMIPAHSIVMTSRATIGECAINTIPVSTNQGFKNFIPFAATDVDFLYYLLTTQKQGFITLCGGSTFLEIGKTQLIAYQVRLPSTKAEQTAIAAILSDMDTELAALQARRAKTQALKQAMMQELLTGRIRLI